MFYLKQNQSVNSSSKKFELSKKLIAFRHFMENLYQVNKKEKNPFILVSLVFIEDNTLVMRAGKELHEDITFLKN